MHFTDHSTPSGVNRLRQALETADAVVIGAGAGLSASAGFTYDGPRFQSHFSDFQARYGFQDMYTGGFFPYPAPEEFWAYWSRYIWVNRYQDPPRPVYRDLLDVVGGKNYFVLTTNVDHCFQKAGFDKQRLFYTQGDYGLFQCAVPCHPGTYDNEAAVLQMLAEQKGLRIPTALLPRCPRCGGLMTINLRSDSRFVEDQGWHQAAERYALFLRQNRGKRVLFWELGVGGNTPAIIKYPFWQMTSQQPQAVYACINDTQAAAPKTIASRAICISGDIGAVLKELLSPPSRKN